MRDTDYSLGVVVELTMRLNEGGSAQGSLATGQGYHCRLGESGCEALTIDRKKMALAEATSVNATTYR